MRLRSVVPTSNADMAADAGAGYSGHAGHHLVAVAARHGLFWSATMRFRPADAGSEPQGAAAPQTDAPAPMTLLGASPGGDLLAGANPPAPSTATVEPLVMASLCDLLYDKPGQVSKPDWTPQQWNAALQQQPWTVSWRFLGESRLDPRVYFGVAFENADTGAIVIANRGTQTGYDLLVSDIDILQGTIPPAFLAAERFAAEIATAWQGSGRQILVTGHSLGGADAQYQAARLGLAGSTFAALGAGFAAPGCDAGLVNYLYPQDAIANLSPHIGEVAYIQPNGPAQWIDLLVTRQYAGEGLHFINNYLEHFGAPGIAPITPVQFVEAIVLAEVAEFFSQGDKAAPAAYPQLGFDELAPPGAPLTGPPAVFTSAGDALADDSVWSAAPYGCPLSMPISPDHYLT